ncbi:hypothetical protein D9M69_407890 [compost metagenome]
MLIATFQAVAIEIAANAVVGFVDAVAELVLVLEQILVDQISESLVLIGRGDLGGLDLAGDIALLVGEEDELFTVTGDQALFLQALKGFFDAAAQGKFVFVDLLDGQGDEVVQRALDQVDITNHEQGAQDLYVECIEHGVFAGLVDGALDSCVQEAFHRTVEAVQGYQGSDAFLVHDQLKCSHLEGIEHGALAVGQMRAGSADLTDFLEDFLHQLKVVRRKGVVGNEALRTVVITQRRTGTVEGDLVAQDVALLLPQSTQLGFSLWCFAQQALLNHFVGIGAGQGQARFEATGDLGEIVGLGGRELTEHRIHVGLGGDNDPCAALTDGAEVFGDGLQGQHQPGIATDELANLVHQEQDAVLGRLGIKVLAHPVAEVLDRDAESLLGLLEPLVRCFGGQSQYLRQGLLDIVLIELVAIALFGPDQTGRFVEGLNKTLIDAALGQVALHVGDVWMVAAESLVLVEHAQEDIEDRVAGIVGARLAVDVEQDDISAIGNGFVDICANHRIAHLAGIEEGNSVTGIPLGIPSLDVGQQVGQGLQEMRLARAEETTDPDAYAVGNGGIS